jgi:hypothetical protein
MEGLQPGDYVDATVELVVLPMAASDYYGPNENLRASMKDGANTWSGVHRQAAGNHFQPIVRRGRLATPYPPVIETDRRGGAEVEIHGGVGWVPLVFAGLERPAGHELLVTDEAGQHPVDQSVHGADFWQTDYDANRGSWGITFNVPLDTPNDEPRTQRFLLRPRPVGAATRRP